MFDLTLLKSLSVKKHADSSLRTLPYDNEVVYVLVTLDLDAQITNDNVSSRGSSSNHVRVERKISICNV